MIADRVRDQIRRRSTRVGLELSEALVELLGEYIGLLTKWNQRLNLTALALAPMTDEATDRLVIEPLMAVRELSRHDRRMVDVGSGGGSPALPMKIAAPWLQLILVEVKTRKSAFLREAVRHLGLADAQVETARIEALSSHSEFSASADVISVRAVKVDDELLKALLNALKPGGRVLWFGAPPANLGHRLPVGLALVARRTLLPEAPDELAILEKSQ